MNRLAPILLIALTLAVYGRLRAADFVEWDDPSTIVRDPAFNPPTVASIARYWIHPQLNLYIPLTCTAWGFLAAIGRVAQPDEFGSFLNPSVFHVANIFVHVVNVLLVWKIARSLTNDRLASWLAAAVFAAHPVQVEAVAWATDLKDLLCTLFALAAILGFIRYRQRNHKFAYVLATVALLAACFSKPTAVVVPCIALIVDRAFLGATIHRSIRALWAWFAVALGFAIVARIVQPPVMMNVSPIALRPLVAADAVSFYLWKLILPIHLGIDYGRSPGQALAQGWLAFTWIFPAALAALLWWRRDRSVAAGAMIFLAALFPVLGFVPFTFQSLSTVADHYLYLPMIGVSIGIAFFLRKHRSFSIVTIIIIGLFAIASFRATRVWMNDATLFANAIEVNPNSAMSQTNWAVSLARHGDQPDAIARLRTAIQIDPDYAFARLNIADLLLRNGETAAALEQYQQLFRIYRMQQIDSSLADTAEAHVAELIRRIESQRTSPTTRLEKP